MIGVSISENIIDKAIRQRNELSLFESQVKEHQDRYIVDDIFYGWNGHSAYELTEGYFCETAKFDSLELAIRNMTYGQALRVIEGKEFIVGNVYSKLSQQHGDANSCIDIATFRVIFEKIE